MKLGDDTLMRFHDGELAGEEARRVRVGRLTDPAVSARLEALARLGTLVRAGARLRGIDTAEERRRVVRGRARRRALVACAAVMLAAFAAPTLVPHEDRAGADQAPPPSTMLSTRGETVVASGPVAVETVDFGARPGAIFRVRGESASETTVVWLPDDSDASATGSL